MSRTAKSALLGAICLSTALGGVPEALAGPMSVAPRDTVGPGAPIESVHYRRYYRAHYPRYYRAYYPRYSGYYPRYRYRRYGYDPAGALFASAALGLVGAGIAAATAPRWGYGWGGPWGYGGGWGYGGFGPWGYGGRGGPFWW